MSVINFLGFDSFGYAVKGGTGTDKDEPTGVGVLNTPILDEFTITYGNPWTDPSGAPINYNNAGITGLDKHKIGVGAERRNCFLIQAGRTTVSSYNTQVLTNPRMLQPGVPGQPWGYRFGFNIVDFTEWPGTPTATGWEHALMYATNVRAGLLRVASGGKNYWRFSGATTDKDIEIVRGQPTHVEIELSCVAPPPAGTTSQDIRLKVWMNGDLVYDVIAWSAQQVAKGAIRMRMTASSFANNTFTSIGISDYFCTDMFGADSVDGIPVAPLGPQVVLPAPLESVVADGWTAVGGTPIQVLADNDDGTYLISPLASGAMKATFNLNLPAGADLNGLRVFNRASRDIGAAASLWFDAKATKVADGSTVGETLNVPLNSRLVNNSLLAVYGGQPGAAAALSFADTGKFDLSFIIKKTGV